MDRSEVEERIEDWIGRLEGLYTQVEAWYRQLPPAGFQQFVHGQVLQNEEEVMRKFDVPPRMAPTCAVLYGRGRLSLAPSGLWVIGGNGRVNATTNTRQFVLLDMGGQEGAPSDWHVVTSRLESTTRKLDEKVFGSLVMHQVLEAA